MTGFGKASLQLSTKKITVEVKSLNSKGLDLNTRMPSVYRENELALRNLLALKLERGKVDFSLYVEVTGEDTSSKINAPIVKAYMAQLKTILPNADDTELMKMAIRMPDTMKTEREEIDENEWKQIQIVIDEAIENMLSFRKSEGASLEKEFSALVSSKNISSAARGFSKFLKVIRVILMLGKNYFKHKILKSIKFIISIFRYLFDDVKIKKDIKQIVRRILKRPITLVTL